MKKILEPKSQTCLFAICLLLPLLVACDVAQAFAPLTQVAADETIMYVVQPGDTVSQIATQYHLTIEQIINLNSNDYPSLAWDPSSIKPGWVLHLPRPSDQTTPEPSQVDFAQATAQIVTEINNQRAQNGLTLLKPDPNLTRIASDRSNDMIARNYFSHTDPQTGQEPLLRYLQAMKFQYRYAGENIAEIKNDAGWVPPWLTVVARYTASDLADEFFNGWIHSPEHLANILNSNYHRTGVALAASPDGHRIVATQTFSD